MSDEELTADKILKESDKATAICKTHGQYIAAFVEGMNEEGISFFLVEPAVKEYTREMAKAWWSSVYER